MFGYRLKWNFLIRNILCLAFNRLSPTTNFFCHRSFYRFSCRAHGLANLLTIDRLINTTNLLITSLAFLKKAFFICVMIGIRYILGFIWKDYRFCLCYRPFRYLIGWVLRLNRSFSHMAFFLCPFGFHHTCIGWVLRLNRGFADMAFFLCPLGFYYTCIGWVLRLNRSFTDMTFFLCPLGFHHTCIGWVLRLNRGFADMAFFLCPFGFHHTCIGWVLRLNRSFANMAFFLCPLSRYNWRRIGLRGWLGIFFCPNSKNLWNWFFSDLAFNDSANFLSIYHTHFCQ